MKNTVLFALALGACPLVAAGAAEPATGDINPFLGAPADIERAKRQLELEKLKTQLLDEQLKQKSAEIEMKQLPHKRDAELRKSLSNAPAGAPALDLPDFGVEAPAPVKTSRKKPKAPAMPVASTVPVAAPPVLPPAVEVVGVTETAAGKTVTLLINGGVASVRDGDNTPAGRVELAEGKIRVGGRAYVLHEATLARQAVPEQPVPNAGGQTTAAGTNPLGGVTEMLRNAGPAQSKGPLPPGLIPLPR